eukprot:TRINITY_DN56355_c0_g1_i1.p1 TRINITY_DN56355_c0_g1~~TRINITY_DN56355_c0_g1_i1.p1  ORF type:complete len:661 (+),score=149.84 TRINITY_DN56355_c0_g1_i1:58-1983(+)
MERPSAPASSQRADCAPRGLSCSGVRQQPAGCRAESEECSILQSSSYDPPSELLRAATANGDLAFSGGDLCAGEAQGRDEACPAAPVASSTVRVHVDASRGVKGTFNVAVHSTQVDIRHVRCLQCDKVPAIPVTLRGKTCCGGRAVFCEPCLRKGMKLDQRKDIPTEMECDACNLKETVPWLPEAKEVYRFDPQIARGLDEAFPDPCPCPSEGCDVRCSRLELYDHVHNHAYPMNKRSSVRAADKEAVFIAPADFAENADPATFSDACRISSYSWLRSCPEPTIVVPGAPRLYRGMPGALAVPRDDPDDGKSAVPAGTWQMTPTSLCLPATFDLSSVDFILTRHVILNLLMSLTCKADPRLQILKREVCTYFQQGRCNGKCVFSHDSGLRSFHFDADRTAQGALVIARSEEHCSNTPDSRGLTHSFTELVTEDSLRDATGFHRVRQVQLADCSLLVTCSVDAVDATNTAAQAQTADVLQADAGTPPAGGAIRIDRAPGAELDAPDVDFKTKNSRAWGKIRWIDIYAQMLVGGTDTIVWGVHEGLRKGGPVEVRKGPPMSIAEVELVQEIDLDAFQRHLGGLAKLLWRIREAVDGCGGSAALIFDPEVSQEALQIKVIPNTKPAPRLPPEWRRDHVGGAAIG